MNTDKEIPTRLPENDLEELYENAPCGYILTTPDGSIVRVNRTFLNQTGYDRADIVNALKIQSLMTTPGRVFYETHFGPLIRIQGFVKEIACDLLRPDGKKLPVLMNAVLVVGDSGQPSLIRFTVFDATERRRYEANLLAARRSSDHYKVIIETSADAIVSVGADGKVQTWNPGAERMFGSTAAEAIGKKAWEIIVLTDDTAQFGPAVEAFRSGQPFYHAGNARSGSGEDIYVTVSLTPHIEPPGILTSVSAIIRDVTERKRAIDAQHRQELLQNLVESQEAERHRIARDLHDHFGQQMTGLRLALTNLKRNCETDEELVRQVEDIQSQAQQIDRDLSFLAFELRPTVLDELGLAGALENFAAEWSHNYNIAVEFHGPPAVSGRLTSEIETNLYRITQESLNNTFKHAKAGQVSIILDERDGDIILIVEDDGKGFSVNDVSGPVKKSGHGLGLIGMRERATILGGTLEIESEPNAGTTIFVRVPAAFIQT